MGKLLLLSEPQFPYLSDKGGQWPYAQWPVRDQWSLPHARQARGFVSGTSRYLFFFLSPHLLSTHSVPGTALGTKDTALTIGQNILSLVAAFPIIILVAMVIITSQKHPEASTGISGETHP